MTFVFRSRTLPAVFTGDSPVIPGSTTSVEATTAAERVAPHSATPSPKSSRRRSQTESAVVSPTQLTTDGLFRKSQFQRKNVTKKKKKRERGDVRRHSSVGSESSAGPASVEGGEAEDQPAERVRGCGCTYVCEYVANQLSACTCVCMHFLLCVCVCCL